MLIWGTNPKWCPRTPVLFPVGWDGRLSAPVRLPPEKRANAANYVVLQGPELLATVGVDTPCGWCGKLFVPMCTRGRVTRACCKAHGIKLYHRDKRAAEEQKAAAA